MAKDPAIGPVTVYRSDGSSEITNQQDMPSRKPAAKPKILPPVVILAGGKGTRLQEETKGIIPKPLIMIGGTTLLEHIIDIYANQGFREFFIASGFMAESIHGWWQSRQDHFKARNLAVLPVVTGVETATGGRLLRLREKLGRRPFMMTYGDGLSDINLHALISHHEVKRSMVTLTASHPPARFGNIIIENGIVTLFGEKTQLTNEWINSGFYIIDPEVFNLVPNDQCRFEYDILPVIALQGKLAAYQHPGFFQMIDTPRELMMVERMWGKGDVPWLTWMKKD